MLVLATIAYSKGNKFPKLWSGAQVLFIDERDFSWPCTDQFLYRSVCALFVSLSICLFVFVSVFVCLLW